MNKLALIRDVSYSNTYNFPKLSFYVDRPTEFYRVFFEAGSLDSFLIQNHVQVIKDLEGQMCWIKLKVSPQGAISEEYHLCTKQDYFGILTHNYEPFRLAAKKRLLK